MLVCKFEINWSTNKNLRALTTYLGRTDGRPEFPYPPLRFAETGDNKVFFALYPIRYTLIRKVTDDVASE